MASPPVADRDRAHGEAQAVAAAAAQLHGDVQADGRPERVDIVLR